MLTHIIVKDINDDHGEPMLTLVEYQKKAMTANRFQSKDEILPPLLGVFGEAGSLLTGAKKRLRESSCDKALQGAVVEELGDVLWYLTAMLNALGLSIADVLEPELVGSPRLLNRHADTFLVMDSISETVVDQTCLYSNEVDSTLILLASSVGQLTAKFHGLQGSSNAQTLRKELQKVFVALSQLAAASGVSMQKVAECNLAKIFDRWPTVKSYRESFDSAFEVDERFPERIVIDVFEKSVGGKVYVFQKYGDFFLGDRLTDNMLVEDDYRFHDVFHFANAAVLSWSPVLRRLLKRKRKSDAKIDEAEDGARAAIIEEAVVAWVFAQACKNDYFSSIDRGELSFGLLKQIRNLTGSYEVAKCPLWQWEEAILQGYEAFRYLKEHRKARITVDMIRHKLECGAML